MTKKIPELRFAGFYGEWEKNELGNVGKFYSGGTPKSSETRYYKGDIPFIRSGEIYNSETKLFINEDAIKESSVKYVRKGDILFAMYGANSGEVCISKVNGAINQAILAIIPNDNFDEKFIETFLIKNKEKANSRFLQGGQKNLSAAIVKSIKFLHGSFEEQEKIGELFEALDACLEDQAAYVETLKKSKKAFLQKLFPKKGEKVPELRFPGFDGDWEVKKLGEFTDIRTGNKDVKDNDEDGEYPFFVRSNNMLKISTYSYDGEAILIPGDGNIGDVYHYINGKFDWHQRVYKISDFEETSGVYIYYYLQKFFKRHAMKNSVKATVNSLRLPTIKNFKIFLPSLPEQEKIGLFFKALDEKIEKEEDKLESFERLKTALLQKVFV